MAKTAHQNTTNSPTTKSSSRVVTVFSCRHCLLSSMSLQVVSRQDVSDFYGPQRRLDDFRTRLQFDDFRRRLHNSYTSMEKRKKIKKAEGKKRRKYPRICRRVSLIPKSSTSLSPQYPNGGRPTGVPPAAERAGTQPRSSAAGSPAARGAPTIPTTCPRTGAAASIAANGTPVQPILQRRARSAALRGAASAGPRPLRDAGACLESRPAACTEDYLALSQYSSGSFEYDFLHENRIRDKLKTNHSNIGYM